MNFRWSKGVWRAAVCVAIAWAARPCTQANTLTGHVPAAAQYARVLGPMAAEHRLELSMGLPLRNREALTNLLNEMYDPASPNFRRFLSVEEFTARFGPTAEDYQSLIEFVKAKGLAISATHPNRMVLDVNGTAETVEKAFQVRLNRYDHPKEAREFYAPDREPTVDLGTAVLDISGLDNFVVPRPANLVLNKTTRDRGTRPLAGSGPGGSYMGLDFRAAYAPNVLLNGAGQYVGLVQFDGYYPSDIAAYVSQARGLTNVALTNILLNGFSGTPGTNNVEVALDIEMAISMAPGLRAVLVYEGLSGNTILNRMATDNLAKQLSASWTFGVNGTTSQIFQQMALQGQSYFNASGDDGAYVGSAPSPADNPFIISVGGTSLSTKAPAQGSGYLSEKAWSWYSTGQNAATGGGISATVAIPSWQSAVPMTSNQGSTMKRNVPDVAMVADNVFAIANNGEQMQMGGTSVASPLWAGFMALVNQQAFILGRPEAGFINPYIYPVGLGTNYGAAFHDVRTGNNTNPASPNAFYAVTGYDLCTGWGSPAGKALINALAPPPFYIVLAPGPATLVLETCIATNGAVDPGEAVVMNLTVQNFGAISTTNLTGTLLASNGIVPYSGTQYYGAIAQGTNLARPFTFSAAGACGSTVQALLKLQDGTSDLGTFNFPILLGPPGGACCTPAATADVGVSQSVYPDPAVPGEAVAFSVVVRGLGPGPATSVVLTNTLPSNGTFGYASPGYTNLGGTLVWNLGLLPLGRATNLTVLVTPTGIGSLTNVAVVGTAAADAVTSNNVSIAVVDVATAPDITRQPVDQVAVQGGDALFEVTSAGSPPLAYQWYFGATKLEGMTDSTLRLTQVQAAQAGTYTVVVSNAAGSTNSVVATLKVLVAPMIGATEVGVNGSTVSVSVESLAGLLYSLEYKDALGDAAWLPVGLEVPGTGATITLVDTNSTLPASRFYRVNCR